MSYTHKDHAGNAGDVWKHLILAEAANYLLAKEGRLIYAESHVGFPFYSLANSGELKGDYPGLQGEPGEWNWGIGRCWGRIDDLMDFGYFRIISEMNPTGLQTYPGSATLTLRLAKDIGSEIEADLWDVDPEVYSSWQDNPPKESENLRVHLGDGFSGANSLIAGSLGSRRPGLLLIDPPYLENQDLQKSEDLFNKAAISGWTVLLWQMIDPHAVLKSLLNSGEYEFSKGKYSIDFLNIGLSCAKWPGASIYLAGCADLVGYINRRARKFLDIMRLLP
jgi:23S rRNA (adenine2030-N6)-methyltransferase